MRIKLTEEQKYCFLAYVEKEEIAQVAFLHASTLIKESREILIEKLQEIFPDAKSLYHPKDEDWYVTICEEKEKDNAE